jgi:predicted amidohydrolase
VKIGVVQFHAKLGQPDENARQVRRQIENAASQGCRLVLFPEMTDTGYEMETIKKLAPCWEANQFLVTLKEAARANDIYVVSGLSERSGDDVFNAVVALNPSGEVVGHYRKIHLFTGAPIYEDRYLKAGSDAMLFQADDLLCGVMVCYDLRFPELARLYAINGVQLLLIASAFPFPRLYHWETLVAARAIENQTFVAAANRVGQDGAVTFCGSSQILDPFGTKLSSCREAGEDLIVADITAQGIADIRSSFNTLRDRRPEIYKGIS